jgi:8-oxo-dGTP pyrophosphatase MutT (NUDIX family)
VGIIYFLSSILSMRLMAAALILKSKKLLLVHNTKHGVLRIEPPGGKALPDETAENCCVRETTEELGVTISLLRLLADLPTSSPEGDFQVKMFLAEIRSGTPTLREFKKISGYGWYTYHDMERLAKDGHLVPNMTSALPLLKNLM